MKHLAYSLDHVTNLFWSGNERGRYGQCVARKAEEDSSVQSFFERLQRTRSGFTLSRSQLDRGGETEVANIGDVIFAAQRMNAVFEDLFELRRACHGA